MDTTESFLVDISDKLQIVDRNEIKPKVHTFGVNDDIYDIISYFLESINSNQAFYIVDLHEVQSRYQLWSECLPRVQAYYAIKSNPDPMILYVLAKLGCGFDCASREEIIMAKANGVPDDKIIYANPCKKPESLQYARSVDVDLMTFDSRSELDKIKLYHPDAKCIIRIAVDDSGSECRFSCKFGTSLEEAKDLLTLAKLDEIDIVGISWHVGSNCRVMGQFDKAFRDARLIFDCATEMGFNMEIIDIGGGFPGVDTDKITFRQMPVSGTPSKLTFRQIAEEINTAIDKHFGDVPNIRFIGEPGRFMCTSSHTLVNTIIGIKSIPDKKGGEKVYMYTIDDTVYGSFNCIKYDYAVPQFQAFNERTEKTYKSTIFGQSCDSMDKELNGSEYSFLPKLAIGDRVFVTNFGAYTCAGSSSFNGFTPPGKHYIIRS